MLDKLTHRTFAPHLNTTFTITYDEVKTLPVELIAVEPRATLRPDSDGRETENPAFSLVFLSGNNDFYLQQRIYKFEHEALGELSMFVVPLGPKGDGMAYEVVFN